MQCVAGQVIRCFRAVDNLPHCFAGVDRGVNCLLAGLVW